MESHGLTVYLIPGSSPARLAIVKIYQLGRRHRGKGWPHRIQTTPQDMREGGL